METYIVYFKLFNGPFKEIEVQGLGMIGYIVAQKLKEGYNDVRVRIK